MLICPRCKNNYPDGIDTCDICGIKLEEIKAPSARHTQQKDSVFDRLVARLPFKVSSKVAKFSTLAVALLLIIILIILIFVPASEPNYMLYIQEGELMYSTVSAAKGSLVYDEAINSSAVTVTNDGNRIFYIDEDGDLRYKNTGDLNAESKKISSNVTQYSVTDNGKLVTFIEDDKDLKQHDLKDESATIAEDVSEMLVSKNGKRILIKQLTESGATNLLLSVNGKEAEEIDSEVNYIYNASEDLKTFYYTKGSAIYSYKEGSEPEKIVKEYSNIVCVYESGEIYYNKISESDNGTTEELYYYNGKESNKITDKYSAYTTFSVSNPVLIYNYGEYDESGAYTQKFYIACGESSYEIDYNIGKIFVEPTGENLYFIADADGLTGEGTLYKAKITKDGLTNIEKIDSNVYKGKFLDKGIFVYVADTDIDTRMGTLYYNSADEAIDEEICLDDVYYIPQKKTIAFFSEIEEYSATLNTYKSGKVKKIDDDVYYNDFFTTANGELMYLKDFDPEDGEGDLYISSGSEGKFVCDEVSKIIYYMCDAAAENIENGYECYFSSVRYTRSQISL